MTSWSAYLGFLCLCLVPLLLGWRFLAPAFALALHNEAYTHLLLILPVSIAFVLIAGGRGIPRPKPDMVMGPALLVGALLVGILAWIAVGRIPHDIRLSLGMLAVVTWWIAAFVCFFGISNSRTHIFSLCFLLWLVPLPDLVLSPVVSLLQQGSASAARLLLALAGVPVSQDGVMLSIPGLKIEVAKECSSIRSSLLLVVTSMVMAQLLLRTVWGKTLAVLAAIPLSIIKNGFRVFVLSTLTVYVDPAFLNGRLHHKGGIVFFLLALGVEFVLLWVIGVLEHYVTLQSSRSKSQSNTAVRIGSPQRIPTVPRTQL